MGGQWSKEGGHVLKRDVDRLKSCMQIYRSNVLGVDSAVTAQNNSVKLLDDMLNELINGHERKSTSLETTRDILFNIQTSLTHQIKAVGDSFQILDHCIQDISERCSQETEIEHEKSDRRMLGNQSKGASASSDDILQRGAVSKDAEKDKIESLRKEIDAVSSSNTDLQNKLKDKQLEIDKFKSEINRMQQFELESRRIKKEKDKIAAECSDLQKKLKDKQGEIDKLKREINHMEYIVSESGRIKKEKDKIAAECSKLQTENRKLNLEILKHERNAEATKMLETSLQESENNRWKLEREVDQLRMQIYDIEEEKRKIQERKMIVPVQLFYQRKDDLMNLVVNELSNMLETQMQTKGMQLNMVRCDNISSIQPDKPILVLCINSSRLGTDASTAIEGVQKSGSTALLIFHHKNIHALPNQPSERMLTSSEFKQLGGIIDMAFLTGKGIYPCDMNNTALSYIESFIQRNCSGQ